MNDRLINIGLFAGATLGAYYLYTKFKSEKTTDEAEKKIISDEPYKVASIIKACFNPSGFEYMIEFDGTDTTTLFRVANKITNFEAVKRAYKELFNRSLVSDLLSELSTAEYQNFLTRVK